MNIFFLNDCAADGCSKKNENYSLKNGKQLCKEHQDMYERGEPLKAFYGKTIKLSKPKN